MNLIEAIKSGRPFRRKMPHEAMRNLDRWRTKRDLDGEIRLGSSLGQGAILPCVRLTFEELLADDWEIQEPTVTITKAQFCSAYADAAVETGPNWSLNAHITLMARKLGLET